MSTAFNNNRNLSGREKAGLVANKIVKDVIPSIVIVAILGSDRLAEVETLGTRPHGWKGMDMTKYLADYTPEERDQMIGMWCSRLAH